MRSNHEPEAQPSDKTLGSYVLILLVFWITVFAYTVHPILPPNPIELPWEDRTPFMALLPQGWGFFTRDPRSEEMTAFLRRPDSWLQIGPRPPMWPRVFELSRSRKLPGVEIGLVLYELANPPWQECREAANVCLDKASTLGPVENKLPSPSLCGDVGIVRQAPLPWAWSASPDETQMPSQVLRVQVSCHE